MPVPVPYREDLPRLPSKARATKDLDLTVNVVLEYRGHGWDTIQVDLSPWEGDFTEVEMVEPLGLDPFGLDTPDLLPCLSLRYHIAQKIHAMTEPPAPCPWWP